MTAHPDPLEALPPLLEVIRAHDLRADKRLGQNFLLDRNLLARIAAAAGDLAGRTVLEVGPGPGGLTRALLGTAADRVIAIESDPRCIAALQSLVAAANGRLALIAGDALEIGLDRFDPPPAPSPALGEKLTIVANLPYNVGTALLLRWLDHLPRIEAMTLMFQKEVADRLVAAPKSGSYGRLSVMVQWCCRTERLFNLPAKAFVPPPKVASALVRLEPRAAPLFPAERSALERVLAAAFGQRRKMLRASLKSLGPEPLALIESAGLAPTARAEEIDIEGFCRLAIAWAASGRPSGTATRV
jgi:16S rRNA (adenine1518-N6/adenine1519-N6)-dimethyltransferase